MKPDNRVGPPPLPIRAEIPLNVQGVLKNIREALDIYDFDQLAPYIIRLLLDLYTDRPDVNDLYEWITSHQKAILEYGSNFDLLGINVELTSFLHFIAYSNDCPKSVTGRIDQLERDLNKHAVELDVSAYSDGIKCLVGLFYESVGLQRKLPITLNGNAIRFGRHFEITFNRTLRIPEDGKDYPLPAGFGCLPICRVEDYAERVPAKWLQEGGFFIPLHQKEALFLEFKGEKWRPCIAKVAVGRINAVTGEAYDEKVRKHKQDYLVIPDQKWLDGINSGEGRVGQFVAMPLGKGYTVEAQVTDEETHGGFQITAFDPKKGRFPDEDPAEEERRRLRAAKRKSTEETGGILYSAEHPGAVYGAAVRPRDDWAKLFEEKETEVVEMGIAKGGHIKQEIVEDTYGAESWDEASKGSIVIHLVNSRVYRDITGNDAPPTPITADEYRKQNIPWFDAYDENSPALMPGKILQHVESIASLEKIKGETVETHDSINIEPDRLRKIKTPNKEERITALIHRAADSLHLGLHGIALRESSCALDLLPGTSGGDASRTLALQIRGEANLALKRFSDAEGDASDCLDCDHKNISALSTRAQALIMLGEGALAEKDAKRILQSQPNHATGWNILQKLADEIIYSQLKNIVKNRDDAEATLSTISCVVERVLNEDNLDFISAIEDHRSPINSELNDAARIFREIANTRRDSLRKSEPLVFRSFIIDYFPHIWTKDDYENAVAFYQRKIESSRAFLKHRSIPTIAEGIEAGLRLYSYNPTALFLLRWWQMDKFTVTCEIMKELRRLGLIKISSTDEIVPLGWVEIDSRIRLPKEGDIENNGFDGSGQTRERSWAPSQVAHALNTYLSPDLCNYRALKLSGNLLLSESTPDQ
jgi:tetratricopeptide (TPR) repeat protein